jgi:hypothetical protein
MGFDEYRRLYGMATFPDRAAITYDDNNASPRVGQRPKGVFLGSTTARACGKLSIEVMYVRRLLAVIVVFLASVSAGAGAKVLTVPSSLTPTIQAAVDSAASSGDVIQIAAGLYSETGIVVNAKNVTIEPIMGGTVSLVYSSGSGTGITMRNTTGGTLLNLIFRGYETAVSLESSTATVQFVTAKACGRGVAVSGSGGAPTVWYCVADSCATGIEVQGGTVTLQNETIVGCSTGVSFLGGSATLSRTIVYRCQTGVQCGGGGSILSCNDYWVNGTDYSGCAAATNDFYLDPKFCFWASSAGPYYLHSTSPCFVTSLNPCGVKIGAFTGTLPGCSGAAAQESSWGAIKAIYR